MAFGTDGTIIDTMPAQSAVQKLTCVQNGATKITADSYFVQQRQAKDSI